MRFPSSSRLTARRQFRAVYDAGVRVSCAELAMFATPNDGERSRLGVTATRKYGGAVARNRARRLIRELFRRHPEALPGVSVDLVVNARGPLRDLGYAQIEPAWLRLLGDLDRRLRGRGRTGRSS